MTLSLPAVEQALIVIAKCDRQHLGPAIAAYMFEHPSDDLDIAGAVEAHLRKRAADRADSIRSITD